MTASGEAKSGEGRTWTIGALVKWATDDFRARGIENPRLDAELLVAHALGISRVQVVIDSARPLAQGELDKLRALVKRRRAREPMAYLLGQREFYGRPFLVDARVLVPRPDTETLVEVALARTARCSMCMRALDLCTGSGCVAITLARQRPTSFVWGADLSEGAVAVARDNALRLGAYNTSFFVSDLYAALDPALRFDLVTANPPYIPTSEVAALDPDIKDFEPRIAIDGGPDGLAVVRRIVEGAPRVLDHEGVLAVEVHAGQAKDVVALFESAGFRDVEVARDFARIERVVSGAKR
jgi:release factor glutamine methyltransferase